MRAKTLITGLTLLMSFASLTAYATPKSFDEMILQSEKARASLTSEKSVDKKISKVLELEKNLKATLDEYRKINPKEGSPAEDKVGFFFDTLDPVFNLAKDKKKPLPETCKKARYNVDFEDRGSKPDDSPLTRDAEEAMKWLDLLCGPAPAK